MPHRNVVTNCILVACAAAPAVSDPDVPSGFRVSRLSPPIDGAAPRLAAIDDIGFGSGVITASVGAGGIIQFRLISPAGAMESLGAWVSPLKNPQVLGINHDQEFAIDGLIHVTINERVSPDSTYYITLDHAGGVVVRWSQGGDSVYRGLFVGGLGQSASVVLLDADQDGGTRLASMNSEYLFEIISQNSVPEGRSDTDVHGLAFDRTGIYGGGILLADSDDNDRISVIYELTEIENGGSYRAIGEPVSYGMRRYADIDIADSGELGGFAYVAERISDEIQRVLPDGSHVTWASKFSGIESLAVSSDGERMYVSDSEGVWLIRSGDMDTGPTVMCTVPSVPAGGWLAGPPVDSVEIVFSEEVVFGASDVLVAGVHGQVIAAAVSGSGTDTMIITFGVPLSGGAYQVRVMDTVLAAASMNALDGDSSGTAGGDYEVELRHVRPGDANGDGVVDGADLGMLLAQWGK